MDSLGPSTCRFKFFPFWTLLFYKPYFSTNYFGNCLKCLRACLISFVVWKTSKNAILGLKFCLQCAKADFFFQIRQCIVTLKINSSADTSSVAGGLARGIRCPHVRRLTDSYIHDLMPRSLTTRLADILVTSSYQLNELNTKFQGLSVILL